MDATVRSILNAITADLNQGNRASAQRKAGALLESAVAQWGPSNADLLGLVEELDLLGVDHRLLDRLK